jgi:chorismate mutase
MTDPIVTRLRAEITELDRAVLEAVNGRLELVEALRRHKEEVGLPFLDPDRERRLLGDLANANRGPLSDDGVRELFSAILELTKRELAGRDGSGSG